MITSYHPSGLPSCPDCGDKSRRLKGDYFWCPSCHAQWEEKDWDNKMAKEKATMTESSKMADVISCLVIDELKCDNCGEMMYQAQKYCVNHSELVADTECNRHITRPKRYCKKCSIKIGWLRPVENLRTGEKTVALFVLQDEVEI